jgi:hypothetical protein
MRRNLFILCLSLVVLFPALPSFSQATRPLGSYQNVIKLNLSSLALKNASLQYERAFGGRVSFGMGASYMPKTGLPFADALMEQFGHNEDARRAIETTELSLFTLTPEIRFYTGVNMAPSGFYAAPFVRFTYMELAQVYSFMASDGVRYNPDVEGSLSYISGGLLLGYQFPIGKRFNLDIWIAGPYVGAMSGDFIGIDRKANMSTAAKEDLKRDIESFELPLTTIEATVGSDQVDVVLGGGILGIRALGFALGFKF